jgi:phosphopantetheinyl transferase
MKKAYFLPIHGLEAASVLERASASVDAPRREKAGKYRKPEDRMRSLGAGILLQYALARELSGSGAPERLPGGGLRQLPGDGTPGRPPESGTRGLLEGGEPQGGTLWEFPPLDLVLEGAERSPKPEYRYGKYQKPYFIGAFSQLFFSLSHSGGYVLCAVSDREIGADIQRFEAKDWKDLGNRFFLDTERRAWKALPADRQEAFFYRLWARKEAYGKLTGEGLGGALKTDVWEERPELCWEEYFGLPGYGVAVCGA